MAKFESDRRPDAPTHGGDFRRARGFRPRPRWRGLDRAIWTAAWQVVCAGSCVACSLVLDADRLQCSVDADCAAHGFGTAACERGLCAPSDFFEGSFGSAGAADATRPARSGGGVDVRDRSVRPAAAPSTVATGGERTTSLYALSLELPRRFTRSAADLELRLCGMDDASCARGARAPATVDAAGQVRLELDAGYRGYLEISDPDLMPTLIFLPRPALPESSPVLYRLLGPLDIELLLRRAELPQTNADGFAIALVLDAAGQRAAGGELSIEAASGGDAGAMGVPYYYRDGVATQAAQGTDEQGAGGWSQLPVGLLRARARRSDDGDLIAVAELWSRPGYVSIVPLQPEVRP